MISNAEMEKEIFKELNEKTSKRKREKEIKENKLLLNPTYFKLDKNRRILNIALGKAEAYNEEEKIQKLKKELENINEKIKEFLEINNYPENFLDIKYDCKKCLDTGILENGELCSCFKQRFFEKLMEEANIDLNKQPYLNEYSLEIFDENTKNQMEKILETFKRIEENINSLTIRNITLSGGTGTGKTYLSLSFLKDMAKLGKTILFTTSYNLNNIFLDNHIDYRERTQLSSLLEADIIVIDDLGSEKTIKNVTVEYLYSLINERNLKNKLTIITTNLNPTEILDRYGERIFSRVFHKKESLLFNFANNDLRIIKKV